MATELRIWLPSERPLKLSDLKTSRTLDKRWTQRIIRDLQLNKIKSKDLRRERESVLRTSEHCDCGTTIIEQKWTKNNEIIRLLIRLPFAGKRFAFLFRFSWFVLIVPNRFSDFVSLPVLPQPKFHQRDCSSRNKPKRLSQSQTQSHENFAKKEAF